jgi:phosphotransferase system enzyme I (PtsI)
MERMGVHPVTFRTLDVGADKQLECLGLAPEENPALGCRGLRVYFQRPDIFRTQLRALLRAAAHGNLAILYPMVTTEEEVAAIQDTVHSVYRELQEEGVPCAIPRQGIMIETPSAAILADKLAHYMDFFCLGTNDLTQYTLAVDRQNPVSILGGEGHSPAVLRLVQYVVEQAHKAGISVSICGELAGDLSLTETFLSLGVDVLSVAPGRILELRARVRELDLGKKQ